MGLFVVSTAPQEEVKRIVEFHEISRYFKDVYGGSTDKKTWFEEIMKMNNYKPSDIVFIGDQLNDLKSAKESGIAFIGRCSKLLENPFPEYIPIFADFYEILSLFETHKMQRCSLNQE